MAKVIGIMGESGSGKTTSCRNLDPSTTYYIDCDKKDLTGKAGETSIMLQPITISRQTFHPLSLVS